MKTKLDESVEWIWMAKNIGEVEKVVGQENIINVEKLGIGYAA